MGYEVVFYLKIGNWKLVILRSVKLGKPSKFVILKKWLQPRGCRGGVVKLASQRSPKPLFQVQVLAPPPSPAIALRGGGLRPNRINLAGLRRASPLIGIIYIKLKCITFTF